MKVLIGAALVAFACVAAALDVNRASRAELETVKGIGPALSARILDERKKGSFMDWADFAARVRGVGAGTAAKLSADGLTVGGEPYPRAASAPKH